MKTRLRVLAVGLTLLVLGASWLVGAGGRSAAGGGDTVWKPILPEADYQQLVERASKAIREELAAAQPDAQAVDKAHALAVLIAAAAQSSANRTGADVKRLTTVRDVAVKLAEMVQQKKLAEAKKQAEALTTLTPDPQAKPVPAALVKTADRGEMTR